VQAMDHRAFEGAITYKVSNMLITNLICYDMSVQRCT
jgi:hypothetical protein